MAGTNTMPPFMMTNDYVPPTTFEKFPIAPQAKILAVRAPPQHVESPRPGHQQCAHATLQPPRRSAGGIEQRARISPQHLIPHWQQQRPHSCLLSAKFSASEFPINIDNLAIKLREYPLRQQAQELEDGFRFGFRLGFIGEKIEQKSKNLTSALELKTKTLEKKYIIIKGKSSRTIRDSPTEQFQIKSNRTGPHQNCQEITDSYTICHGPREHQSMIK